MILIDGVAEQRPYMPRSYGRHRPSPPGKRRPRARAAAARDASADLDDELDPDLGD